ncbi:hypothetical protein [Planctomicrobium sp. SH527]|uniref:hypothetical protein n=1 Tax=Planctomicrobium sp. SH527 TaxID=3448123 RepID=UPI003F5BC2C7
MASKRLLDKRREYEAAEKQGKVKKETTSKKSGTRKAPARKRKAKAPERKRLMWGVFSGTLKEEGRFAYNEKDKAEEKLALLRSKSKKLYFIQPIKESLNESSAAKDEVRLSDEEEILDDEAVLDSDDDADDDADADEDDDYEGEEEE